MSGSNRRAGLSRVPAEVLPATSIVEVAEREELDFCFVQAGDPNALVTVAELGDAGIAALWSLEGVLTRVAEHMGWSRTLALTSADPAALAAELDRALHAALVDVLAGRVAGASGFVIADDLAGGGGWLLSPDYALDTLVPAYRRIVAECGSAGATFHSDGDVRALYPALAGAGFSAVHCAVPLESMPGAVAAAEAAGLGLLGGISAAYAVGRETEIAEVLSALSDRGTLAICDDGAIQTTRELEACLRVIREVRGREHDARGPLT